VIGRGFFKKKRGAYDRVKTQRTEVSFPEVHPQAKLTIEFQRTLRIPDDDKTYPLPPGLGAFPLKHVDDHAEDVPATWRRYVTDVPIGSDVVKIRLRDDS
jgi:hypothetical protein